MPRIRYAGLTTMVLAQDYNDVADRREWTKDLAAQLEVATRTHVGDVTPKGAPMFTIDGPVPRPDQSPLLVKRPELVYIFTYAVPVDLDELPADCTAYAALVGKAPTDN